MPLILILVFGLLFVVGTTQISIPLLYSRPVFPLLRKKKKIFKLLADLDFWIDQTNAELEVAETPDRIELLKQLRTADQSLEKMKQRLTKEIHESQ